MSMWEAPCTRLAPCHGAQSPLNHVSDGPLAAAMKDTHQTERHAHFEDGSGDSYDSSAVAHRHAIEYDEVGWSCTACSDEVYLQQRPCILFTTRDIEFSLMEQCTQVSGRLL